VKKNTTVPLDVSLPEPGQKEYRLFWRALKKDARDHVERLFSLATPEGEALMNAHAACLSDYGLDNRSQHLLQMEICVLKLELVIWRWAEPLNLGGARWRDNGARFLSQAYSELRAEFEKRCPAPVTLLQPTRFSADMSRKLLWGILRKRFPVLGASSLHEILFWEGLFHDHILIRLPADGEMTEREGIQALRDEFGRQLSRHTQSIKWKSEPTWPDKRDDTDHYNWLVQFQCREEETVTDIAAVVGQARTAVRDGIRGAADSIGLILRDPAKGGASQAARAATRLSAIGKRDGNSAVLKIRKIAELLTFNTNKLCASQFTATKNKRPEEAKDYERIKKNYRCKSHSKP